MLTLFYSLAIHMHQSPGGWPTTIGDRGFPPSLVIHADLQWMYVVALVLVSVFVLPIILLVCLIVPAWRRFVVYLILYALFYGICWGLMFLAPKPFLNWWWD